MLYGFVIFSKEFIFSSMCKTSLATEWSCAMDHVVRFQKILFEFFKNL